MSDFQMTSSNDLLQSIFLYNDTFQCNDPLGLRKESIEAFYMTFPCLDNPFADMLHLSFFYWSVLHDISLFRQSFRWHVTFFFFFKKTQLTKYSTNHCVKHIVCMLTGDNLVINQMSGSFSADYFCRTCSMLWTECFKAVKEN